MFDVVNPADHKDGGLELQLADECASYHYDPYGWVLWAFDWGVGDLKGFDGPDKWQKEFLIEWGKQLRENNFDGVTPVLPVRYATASGHGIGKSALTAWVIMFIMSTRPNSKGVVTANTGEQLRTKTWAELGKWKKRCIVGHWFAFTNSSSSMSFYHKSWPEAWRVDAQTCEERNSEAFAGLHAAEGSPFYIFDEASGVPAKIWEVAEGGLTDGEPMMFVFGNPTQTSGEFYECFNNPNSRWITRQIDSRTSKMTNKELIKQWAEDEGEDSDFFRVRVRGVFPKASVSQFIGGDIVIKAMNSDPGRYLGDDPLICSIDVSRGGDDDCMIGFRRGYDAKSEQTYRIKGEDSRDSMKVVGKIAYVLNKHKPDITFIDEGNMGGPIIDRLRELGFHVQGVLFGGDADNKLMYRNKTAEMGDRLRKWLLAGGAIPNSAILSRQLTTREYWYNDKGQLCLEKKTDLKLRLKISPDWADQLYMLFAYDVPKRETPRGMLDASLHQRAEQGESLDYDPLDNL